MLRLKQLARKEYTDITARLAVAMRRYEYAGSGIVDTIGSLRARCATNAMFITAEKTAMRVTFNAAKKAVPHLIARKVSSTIVAAATKRKIVDIDAEHSQEPPLKKALVDTGGIGINALIDCWYCIRLKRCHKINTAGESIKSYEYDEYQPITGAQLNSAGQITITIENQDQFLHLHNSYLLIEGDVAADFVALANNGLLYIFSSLKLTLAGQTMEHVNYPGQATSLLSLASYSSTFSSGCGLSQIPTIMELLIMVDLIHDT